MASKNAARQFRMWMPNMPLTMVSARSSTATTPAYATFRTPPRMTKHEIKEYLTKIYDLPVRKVNTMNYEGKRKRIISRAGIAYYKYKDFKKAVVYFDDTLQDVGLGMRVPELEEGANDDAMDLEEPEKLPK
jgi:large subunit ribosomal protein L23